MKQELPSKLKDYPTINKNISIKNRDVKLTVINHPDNLLEIFSREDSDGVLYLPYWTYLWDSANILAEYISELGDLKNKSILEIGCGFGLVGIVASLEGGKVLFSDFEFEALIFARENSRQNGIESPTLVQMDWNNPCLKSKFDLIIASDVIYDEQNWKPIIGLLQETLKDDGVALFSEPNRDNASGFLELLNKNGLNYEKSTCSLQPADNSILMNIYSIHNNPVELT
ncbi:methyltransferase domain-containing protein [Candidatus Poribacteria bacterium]|nr:methyltransferase domain-containing protein [Candidatus Poribacteria bacterium]